MPQQLCVKVEQINEFAIPSAKRRAKAPRITDDVA